MRRCSDHLKGWTNVSNQKLDAAEFASCTAAPTTARPMLTTAERRSWDQPSRLVDSSLAPSRARVQMQTKRAPSTAQTRSPVQTSPSCWQLRHHQHLIFHDASWPSSEQQPYAPCVLEAQPLDDTSWRRMIDLSYCDEQNRIQEPLHGSFLASSALASHEKASSHSA